MEATKPEITVTLEALEAMYRENFISSIQGNMLFDAALQAIAMQIFSLTVAVYPKMNAPELYLPLSADSDHKLLRIEQQTLAHAFTLDYAYTSPAQLAFELHESFWSLTHDLETRGRKLVPGTMRINLHLVDRYAQTYSIMLLCVSIPDGASEDEKNESQSPTPTAC